jgi:hypothetical protein
MIEPTEISELKARAALAGMSISDYLMHGADERERPSLEEMRARLDRRPAAKVSISAADAVRAERGPISSSEE